MEGDTGFEAALALLGVADGTLSVQEKKALDDQGGCGRDLQVRVERRGLVGAAALLAL